MTLELKNPASVTGLLIAHFPGLVAALLWLMPKPFTKFECMIKVDLALTNGHFGAEALRAGGVEPVLGMHALNVRRQNVHRIHWIGLAVQDQVGGVEVHAHVI
ncbi:MAG TPA: hypothetical protein VKJ01_03570 [Candidatus Solibacter sp.]|nr:hypothetical protein [Candidatus Solibacter sp.]